jgi:hypothetical protein
MRCSIRSIAALRSVVAALALVLLLPLAAFAAPPEAFTRARLPDAPPGSTLTDVVVGGPGFIAVGSAMDPTDGTPTPQIWTSPDGRSWTAAALSGDAAQGQIRGIAAVDGGFLAVGGICCPDQGLVWRSPDGFAWTRDPAAPQLADSALFDVAQLADGTLVAIGCVAVMECGGGLALRSSDGGGTWSDPASLPGLFVDLVTTPFGLAAGGTSDPYEGSPVVARSPDGVTWAAATLVSRLGTIEGVAPSDGGALALGSSEASLGAVPRSLVAVTEGTAWGIVSGDVRRARFHALLPVAGGLVVGGSLEGAEGPRPAAWWSADASGWTRIRIPTATGQVLAMAVDEAGTVVAVGWTGSGDQTAAIWSGSVTAG